MVISGVSAGGGRSGVRARAPRLVAAAVIAATLCAVAPSAVAAPSAEAERIRAARAHYERAVSHYNLDEFEPALAEFREAYREKPDASFLFNIAQCHRKLGQREAALDFYRKDLRSVPDAPNRADVERVIADLQARGASAAVGVGAGAGAPIAAPPGPEAPVAAAPGVAAPASVVTPLSTSATAPASAPLALAARPTPAPAAPVHRSLAGRWWFWTGIGAVAVGIVVLGFALTPNQPWSGNLQPGVLNVPSN
jgi:tetratricopeptide (TPR) repeat protein